MTDDFSNLFLNSVELSLEIVNPDCIDFLRFFKIFRNDVCMKDIDTEAARNKLWELADSQCHPSKYSDACKAKAAAVSNKIKEFKSKSQGVSFNSDETPCKKKIKLEPQQLTLSKHPKAYDCTVHGNLKALKKKEYFSTTSAKLCYHMRGQFIHRKLTGRNITEAYETTLEDFRKLQTKGGSPDIEAIKDEIVENGPVLSRSFRLQSRQISDTDYPVIIGWEEQEMQGDVWVVQTPKHKSKKLHIAMGTCEIEDDIVIPKENPRDIRWQEGEYFLIEHKSDEWKNWGGIVAKKSAENILNFCGKLGGDSVTDLSIKKVQFEVYNKRFADSKRAFFKDISFKDGKPAFEALFLD
eukprot:m.37896 g.37896  ORF g.37896 m.37896 type:complete len:353 (+) comp9368_c0_seq1:199-1257(+)